MRGGSVEIRWDVLVAITEARPEFSGSIGAVLLENLLWGV